MSKSEKTLTPIETDLTNDLTISSSEVSLTNVDIHNRYNQYFGHYNSVSFL